ncbi:MAG: hypothetical protein M3270_06375 [Thermoproteota archaeon]|nr:hypothetical protein [Thermoproteota archaeon]
MHIGQKAACGGFGRLVSIDEAHQKHVSHIMKERFFLTSSIVDAVSTVWSVSGITWPFVLYQLKID